MTFSKFNKLHGHDHHLVLDHLCHLSKILRAPLELLLPLPPQPQASHLPIMSIDLPFLDVSYKQNHTICDQRNLFKSSFRAGHSLASTCPSAFPSTWNKIPAPNPDQQDSQVALLSLQPHHILFFTCSRPRNDSPVTLHWLEGDFCSASGWCAPPQPSLMTGSCLSLVINVNSACNRCLPQRCSCNYSDHDYKH